MISPAKTQTLAALTDLLALLKRSFPHYVRFSDPYIPPGRDDVLPVFDDIVADQDLLVERVAEYLDAEGAPPTTTRFPMEYTDSHDLSIDYLLERAIHYQQRDVESLRQLSEMLSHAPSAKALVDEAYGMAHAHLQSLQECRPQA